MGNGPMINGHQADSFAEFDPINRLQQWWRDRRAASQSAARQRPSDRHRGHSGQFDQGPGGVRHRVVGDTTHVHSDGNAPDEGRKIDLQPGANAGRAAGRRPLWRKLAGLLGLQSIDGRKRRPGRSGKKAISRKGRKGADSPVGTRSNWGGRAMIKVRPGADGWEPDPAGGMGPGGQGRPPALRHTQPRNPGLLRRGVEAVLGRGEQAKWQDLEHALQGIGGSVEPTRQPGVFAVHTDDPRHRDQAVWTLKQHGVPGEAISVHGGQTFIDFNKFKALTDAARYKDIEALAHCVKSLFPHSHTGLADTLEQAGATTLARYCRQGWGEATEIAEAALAADPRRLPEPLRREFAGLIGRKWMATPQALPRVGTKSLRGYDMKARPPGGHQMAHG